MSRYPNISNETELLKIPQIDSHLTAKLYVDNSIDEPSLIRNKKDNDFDNHNVTNINTVTLNK